MQDIHVLVLPSELYCPPEHPLQGIFQRHLVDTLAPRGIKVGVASFGFISWKRLFSPYPYPPVDAQGGVGILRRFVRPIVPPRVGCCFLRRQLLEGYRSLVVEYIARYGRPDLIHAHNAFYAGLAACRIRNSLGIPAVLTEHSSSIMGSLGKVEVDALQEVLRETAGLSAVGSSLAHRLERLRPPGVTTPCAVIGNVLDPFIEKASACILDPPDVDCGRSGFRLLSIGGLIPVKDHSLLLKSFARAFLGDSSVQLRIGGAGPLAARLRDEAHQLGVGSRTVFLGNLSRAQVAEELKACHAVVSTSRVETFGVVLIEAMAFGKPVVATRCGGPQDFVGEGLGILVDRNVDEVASALRAIRGASFDPRAIREACLGRFGAEAFFQRLMALYTSALAANSNNQN